MAALELELMEVRMQIRLPLLEILKSRSVKGIYWLIIAALILGAIGICYWSNKKADEPTNEFGDGSSPTSGKNGAGYDTGSHKEPDGSIVDFVSDADPADTIVVNDSAIKLSPAATYGDDWIVYNSKNAFK